MTHAELVRERKMSEKRRKKREAAEGKHTHPPVGNTGATGRRIPRWDDFVPPDDLNTSKRRVR
jgi:hypothetical protein